MRWLSIGLIASLLFAAAPARAQIEVNQGGDVSRYQMMYGDPVQVSLDDLVQEAGSYANRAIRTKGRLDMAPGVGRAYTLRSTFGQAVRIMPVPEVDSAFEEEAPRMIGEQIEVTGVVVTSGSTIGIQFWGFEGPQEKSDKPIVAKTVTLEDLVTKLGRYDGQTLRVVGKFRGRNLYGDLPVKSELASADWVIKDDLYAIWVTGHKSKGQGWSLDSSMRRDTGKWLEVAGRVETKGGVVYLQAKTVTLTEAPKPTADALPAPPPPERPKVPPALVFSLPLDGESDIPRDSHFVVQFSKDMNEDSFTGHVALHYVGPVRPGDRALDGMKVNYDGGLRALSVDPGDLLRPGREVELLLLSGILDIDGLALVPRAGAIHGDVVDALRYRVSP
jgi:hypothetical protein